MVDTKRSPFKEGLRLQLLGAVAADSPQLSASQPLPQLQRAVSIKVAPFPSSPHPQLIKVRSYLGPKQVCSDQTMPAAGPPVGSAKAIGPVCHFDLPLCPCLPPPLPAHPGLRGPGPLLLNILHTNFFSESASQGSQPATTFPTEVAAFGIACRVQGREHTHGGCSR